LVVEILLVNLVDDASVEFVDESIALQSASVMIVENARGWAKLYFEPYIRAWETSVYLLRRSRALNTPLASTTTIYEIRRTHH
jgi:hypothetical protein